MRGALMRKREGEEARAGAAPEETVAGAVAGEAGEPGQRKGNRSDRWTPPVGGREREGGRGRWAAVGDRTWAGGSAGLKGGKSESFSFSFF
jgi:hypothetical protein